MDILVNNMKRQQVGRGEALINQGEADGAHFYIVLSGAFDVYLDQVWAFGHAPTQLAPFEPPHTRRLSARAERTNEDAPEARVEVSEADPRQVAGGRGP